MAILFALSLLTVFAEIMLCTFALTKIVRGRIFSPVIEVLVVSVGAAGVSWLVPVEAMIGATLRNGFFEPWSVGFVVCFWTFIAVPAAILFHTKAGR